MSSLCKDFDELYDYLQKHSCFLSGNTVTKTSDTVATWYWQDTQECDEVTEAKWNDKQKKYSTLGFNKLQGNRSFV